MKLVVIMGVAGCGKTTVAQALAERTGGLFLEGDDFHSVENRQKMTAGVPLTDEDRWGWLDALNHEVRAQAHAQDVIVLACSALAQRYRDRLAAELSSVHFVYLKVAFEEALRRLLARSNHFMPPSLLSSQYAVLEEPSAALTLDARKSVAELVEAIVTARWPAR